MNAQLPHKQRLLRRVRRAVIKIGSSILSTDAGIDRPRLRSLAGEICALRRRGIELLVVSSGAVAAGRARLGMKGRPKTLPERQAAAAVGQIDLMALYEEYFAAFSTQVAQILLTHDDLANRRRYLNARHTIETLFDARVVPVANENDTVVTDELRNFGDNDNLSALIAGLVEADVLVMLSDVAGLFTKDPRTNADAQLVSLVEDVGRGASAYAMAGRGPLGTGGMASKLAAAKKAAAAGIPAIIADGLHAGVLPAVFDTSQAVGTLVLPEGDRLGRRKHWIAYTLKPSGTVVVDQGAFDAVTQKGRSLLPKGLTAVEGKFGPGDCVRCVDPHGHEFARGLVNYSAAELDKIKGVHSAGIEAVLGYKLTAEVIHRNDLVLTGSAES
ncbi:MAG TPA: glutamate 5-kinase [Candidatus Margulisiibacteriota bacterium]|nr:glutamate 5-kinase [Candidatus Margulisiibacteriota bacterium]